MLMSKITEMSKLMKIVSNAPDVLPDATPISEEPLPKRMRPSIVDEFGRSASPTSSQSIETAEIAQYRASTFTLKNGETLLEWWKNTGSNLFPRLYKVAKFLLPIPASSASSERMFSKAGFVLNERRQRLSPNSVDDILLHSNTYL